VSENKTPFVVSLENQPIDFGGSVGTRFAPKIYELDVRLNPRTPFTDSRDKEIFYEPSG
jgi:hypothetical protein